MDKGGVAWGVRIGMGGNSAGRELANGGDVGGMVGRVAESLIGLGEVKLHAVSRPAKRKKMIVDLTFMYISWVLILYGKTGFSLILLLQYRRCLQRNCFGIYVANNLAYKVVFA